MVWAPVGAKRNRLGGGSRSDDSCDPISDARNVTLGNRLARSRNTIVLGATDRPDDNVDTVDLDESARREDELVGIGELGARGKELDASASALPETSRETSAATLEERERGCGETDSRVPTSRPVHSSRTPTEQARARRHTSAEKRDSGDDAGGCGQSAP